MPYQRVVTLASGLSGTTTSTPVDLGRAYDQAGTIFLERTAGTQNFTAVIQGRMSSADAWATIKSIGRTKLNSDGVVVYFAIAVMPQMRVSNTAGGEGAVSVLTVKLDV